jgi:hypothetical protein
MVPEKENSCKGWFLKRKVLNSENTLKQDNILNKKNDPTNKPSNAFFNHFIS